MLFLHIPHTISCRSPHCTFRKIEQRCHHTSSTPQPRRRLSISNAESITSLEKCKLSLGRKRGRSSEVCSLGQESQGNNEAISKTDEEHEGGDVGRLDSKILGVVSNVHNFGGGLEEEFSSFRESSRRLPTQGESLVRGIEQRPGVQLAEKPPDVDFLQVPPISSSFFKAPS